MRSFDNYRLRLFLHPGGNGTLVQLPESNHCNSSPLIPEEPLAWTRIQLPTAQAPGSCFDIGPTSCAGAAWTIASVLSDNAYRCDCWR